jgi:hypothetical protein
MRTIFDGVGTGVDKVCCAALHKKEQAHALAPISDWMVFLQLL